MPREASEAPTAASESLGGRAFRGSLWTLGGYGSSQLLRLIANLILTRLLFPEAFGLMALVNAVMTGLTMFSDIGLAPSIIRSKRGDDPGFLATAWTLQIARGLILWLVAFLLAAPIANFYANPELYWLWSFATLAVLIGGFNSMSLPRLRRHVEIRKLVTLEFLAQVCGLAVMIACALQWREVWVLVAGGLVAATVRMVGSHFVEAGRRERLGWDPSAARELFGFGKWVFASTILAFCVGQADRLIFGKLVTLSELGVYSIALTLSAIPSMLMRQLGNSVVFPTFSRAVESAEKESGEKFASVYARTRDTILAVGGLPVVVLLASGVPLIETLYDPRYADAGQLVQILALVAWLRVLEVSSGCALLAWGVPRQIAVAGGLMLAGIVVLLPVGWHLGGLQGAVGGYVVAEGLRYGMIALDVRRRGAPGIWRDLVASVLLAATAAGGMAAASLLGPEASSLARLATSAAVGAGLWALVAAAVIRRDVTKLVSGVLGRA